MVRCTDFAANFLPVRQKSMNIHNNNRPTNKTTKTKNKFHLTKIDMCLYLLDYIVLQVVFETGVFSYIG